MINSYKINFQLTLGRQQKKKKKSKIIWFLGLIFFKK